jgi:hypothetical protein
MKNRTVAIIATTVTATLCGLLGLATSFLGAFMALDAESLSKRADNSPQTTLVIGILFIFLGLGIILIPVGVGYVSLRLSNQEEKPTLESDETLSSLY